MALKYLFFLACRANISKILMDNLGSPQRVENLGEAATRKVFFIARDPAMTQRATVVPFFIPKPHVASL